jgi:hypothetical protein
LKLAIPFFSHSLAATFDQGQSIETKGNAHPLTMKSLKSDIVNPYLSGRKPSSSTPAVVPILTPQAKSSTSSSSNEKRVSLPPASAEASVHPIETTTIAVVSEMKTKKSGTPHHNNNMSKRQQLISELRTLKKQQQLQLQQLELYKLQKKQRKLLKKQKKQQQQQEQQHKEHGTNTSIEQHSSTGSDDNVSKSIPGVNSINAQEMTKTSSITQHEQQSSPQPKEKESKPMVAAAVTNMEQPTCSNTSLIVEPEKAATTTETPIDNSDQETTPNEQTHTLCKPVEMAAADSPLDDPHQEHKEPSNTSRGTNHCSTISTGPLAHDPGHQPINSQPAVPFFQNACINNALVYPYPWMHQQQQQRQHQQQQQQQIPQYPWQYDPRPFDTIGTYPSPWNYTSQPFLLSQYPFTPFPGLNPSLRYTVPWQQLNHTHSALVSSQFSNSMANSNIAWNHAPSEPAKPKPPSSQMAIPNKNMTAAITTAKKKLAATRLASAPCESPSPFAKTHDILNDVLHVVKSDDANSSYGVILKLDMRSVLMENSEILNPATNNVAANTVAAPQKTRRRKRFFFSVLMVSDPSVHNKRRLEATSADEKSTSSPSPLLLQTDDIIMEINGSSTANLTFHEACSLFKTCTTSTKIDGINQKMIVCPVQVARRRVAPPKPLVLAVPALLQNRPLPSKGPLDKIETRELALGAFWVNWDPRRLLGQPPSSGLLGQITFHSLTSSTLLNNRGNSFDVEASWNGIRNQIETKMKRAASEYWNEKWKNVPGPHWTDAKLVALRTKPRPSSGGCRCGSKDHRYVNDPKCPLYRDLLSLVPEGGETKESELILSEIDVFAERKRALSKSLHESEKDLNVVQKAFTERIIRIQTESEVDLVEAKFINRMEKVQLLRLEQAVAAPKSLTAIVLSTIFELESEFHDREKMGPLLQLPQTPTVLIENKVTPATTQSTNINSVERDSDDEDDDVPLAALGKRMPDSEDSLPDDSLHSEKRRRGNPSIVLNSLYLARMIQFLSYKWGHVYREPSNEEYLWYVFYFLSWDDA